MQLLYHGIMSAYQLKWVAIVTMIIDHMGLFLFPQFLIFRMIGRISFPLFAWFIANGAYHTHNIKKYLFRLYIFALVSQIPFLMANRLLDPQFSGLNVIATLFIGLAAIYFIQRTNDWKSWFVIAAICATIAQLLQTDYGGFGVLVIIFFYVFYHNYLHLVIVETLLFFAPCFLPPVYIGTLIEPVGLLALLFIRFYNNKPGLQVKYLFYFIYPMQFIIFSLLLMSLLKITF